MRWRWLLAAGAAFADPDKDESGKGREHFKDKERWEHREERRGEPERRRGSDRGEDYFHRHRYTRLDIPDGHLPPPGECRVWYPGWPAGHQPPPGSCSALGARVPAGAWLLRRPQAQPRHFDVVVYDQRQPGVVISIGIFDAATGAFLSVTGSR